MKIFLSLCSLLFSSLTMACSCATPSLAESFAKADFVYVGKIESAELTSETEITNYVSIEQEFKGHRDTDILVSTVSYTSCSSPSAVGYTYVIFGNYGVFPKLQSCTQTQVLLGYQEELLDELRKLANDQNN